VDQAPALTTEQRNRLRVILTQDPPGGPSARLRVLAPGIELEGALTVRPGTDTDRSVIDHMWPRW
jgi:hypothetical protein